MLSLVLMLPGSATALAQGRVQLRNDEARPVVLGDASQVMAADVALAGQAVPTTAALPSGITLMVGLYAGTSSTCQALVSSVALNPAGGSCNSVPGMICPKYIILPFPGGSLAYMQVKVWDAKYSSYEAQWTSGAASYAGSSPMFTMTPGTVFVYPLINRDGGSTWGPGPIVLTGWPLHRSCIYISSQPVSQTVFEGTDAAFTVRASDSSATYQWYFKTSAILGATGNSLTVRNAQLADAGVYRVQARADATVISENATLTVLPRPPIASPLASQTAEVGDAVYFYAGATGTQPLAYSWFFNGSNPLGSFTTNSNLRLANVQFTDSGAYTVVVTNIGGAVTSAPAMLNVIAPVPRRTVPGLLLIGTPGTQLTLDRTYAIARSPNWASFDTMLLTNSVQWYFDLVEPASAQWFYRGWHTDAATQPPTLQPYLVPALTMTGTAGANLRIDYINRVGPTDAWTTLSTVTLTNSSGYYFDTSAPYQPPRLYRVQSTP